MTGLIALAIAAVVAAVAGFTGLCLGSLWETVRPGGIQTLVIDRDRLQDRAETMRRRQERFADLFLTDGPLDPGASAELLDLLEEIADERRIACLDAEMDEHLRDRYPHGF